MDALCTEVGAFEDERLRELASRPNTTVYTPKHDFVHEPWRAERLRPLLERIAARVCTFDESVCDFAVRKACLEDPDVRSFQRQHPKLYWLVTDRKMVTDANFQKILGGFLAVRDRVECGEVAEGHEADALATQAVVAVTRQ